MTDRVRDSHEGFSTRSFRKHPSGSRAASLKGGPASELESPRSDSGPFGNLLQDRRRRDLPELLDDVYEKGEKLKGRPVLENIREYRVAVMEFMDHVVSHMMSLEEKVSGSAIRKRKKFTLLRVIDEKLETLAADVLRDQSQQLRILQQVEEINGLLVDLMT